MFDILTRGFRNAQLKLQGKIRLDEDNLAEALREVRTSLIQADVEIGVVKDFMERVKNRSLGEIVPVRTPDGRFVKLGPQEHFIKACYDELVALMGPPEPALDLAAQPAIVMLVGLQGSGKTTTAGKIAKRLLAEGRKPLLVAADVQRPAAIEQLMVIGRKIGVPVFSIKGMDPVTLARMAVTQARNVKRDVVLIDTAGRLAIDEKLMDEVVLIKETVGPGNILFVVDAMIGQDAVRTAKEFDRRLDFTGFILTKLDGDARGGAALSIKAVTGKPIKFLGQGEDLDRIEDFRPEGLAQRILGFGDVVGLMQDFERHIDKAEAEADAEKMLQGQFSYDDFIKQLRTIRKMGPLRDIAGKMPIISGLMDQIPEEAWDDEELDRSLAIVHSMTREERRNPDILDKSRFARIARGSGRDPEDVEEFHQRFGMAREMIRGLGSLIKNPALLEKMKREMARQGEGGFEGLDPEEAAGQRRMLSPAEKIARRRAQKDKRKSRKKNRR